MVARQGHKVGLHSLVNLSLLCLRETHCCPFTVWGEGGGVRPTLAFTGKSQKGGGLRSGPLELLLAAG